MKLELYEFTPLAASLFLSIVLSVIANRNNNNDKCENSGESRVPQLKLFPVIASLITSYTSGVSLLGKPAEAYQFGIQFQVLLTFILIQSSLSLLFFMPVALKLRGSSIYEYFGQRFDWKVEKIAVAQFAVSKVFMTALHSLSPALILSYFTGITVNVAIIVIISLTTACTMIGGFKGVVWTDALQATIMFISLIGLMIISVVKVGGMERVFQLAYDTDRLTLQFPMLDPSERLSFWVYLTGFNVAMVMNQSWYQRIKALKSDRDIKWSLMFQTVGLYVIGMGSCFMGLAIHAYYYGCDPKTAKIIDSYSNIVIYWLEDIGGKIPGILGLYISGITCGSFSSISTNLNSVAEMTVDVFVRPSSKVGRIRWIQLWTLLVGVSAVFIALYIKNTDSLVELNHTFVAFDGITTGLFVLGALFIPATVKGALSGALTSAVVTCFIIITSKSSLYPSKPMSTDLCEANFNHTISHHGVKRDSPEVDGATSFFLVKLSPFVTVPVATATTVIVGAVVSWIWPEKEPRSKSATNPDLYLPVVHRFLLEEWLEQWHHSSNEHINISEGAEVLLPAKC